MNAATRSVKIDSLLSVSLTEGETVPPEIMYTNLWSCLPPHNRGLKFPSLMLLLSSYCSSCSRAPKLRWAGLQSGTKFFFFSLTAGRQKEKSEESFNKIRRALSRSRHPQTENRRTPSMHHQFRFFFVSVFARIAGVLGLQALGGESANE